MATRHPGRPGGPAAGPGQAPLHAVTGLPAGIGLSQVRVYSSQAPDGQCSGTPHLHLACTELYFPLRGGGAAEFLTPDGPSRIDLRPGVAVQFTPGTLHRLVNGPDPLEVLVIMENGRLNEEGDVVFTFPNEDLADPDLYARLAAVGPPSAPDRSAVERRRDRAVTGFLQLLSAWHDNPQDGLARLRRLYRLAAALVAPRAARWPQVIAGGPAAALERLSARTAAIADHDPSHLDQARVTELAEFNDTALTPRSCGDLWSYQPAAP